jgi:hypothetical protein
MMQPGAMSCVSGGNFVPCPPGTQMPNSQMSMGGTTQPAAQPAAAAAEPKMEKKAKKKRRSA